jgi:hypothetical protein
MNIDISKWKVVGETTNFVLVYKKSFRKITTQDFFKLLEEMRSLGYKANLMNYGWDGSILFEKIKEV